MINVFLEYCIDGYNDVKIDIFSFDELKKKLQEIQERTTESFSCPFAVDVVIEGVGRISVGLADQTILCYSSDDFENQMTSVGDISAEGNAAFYFGDYSIMSKKHVISYDLAIEVLEYWINEGKLSDKIEWTHEIF